MRIGCFLVLVLFALLVGGGQGVYTALTNPEPHECTVESYLRGKPSDKWLRLTGGTLSLVDLNYASWLGVGPVTEIYLPLRPSGTPLDGEVGILVATKDQALLKLAEQMRHIASPSETQRFVREHRQELLIQRNVQGLVRYGIELKDDDVRKFRKLNGNLASDFVVLDEGGRPDYFVSGALLLAGLGLGTWMVKNLRKPSAKPPPLPGSR